MKKLVQLLVLLFGITGAHAQSSDLDVRDLKVVPEGNGISAITGTATNESQRMLSNAFVKFNLYDSQSTVVGNAIDHVANLAPGDSWNFKAETPTRFSTTKLTEVQVFPPAR